MDLQFVAKVFEYINTLDGAVRGLKINSIPGEWRAADFGKCYFNDCCGLAIFSLCFNNNKSGTAARRAVMEEFFTSDGKRKDISDEEEKEIILQQIENSKITAKRELSVDRSEK